MRTSGLFSYLLLNAGIHPPTSVLPVSSAPCPLLPASAFLPELEVSVALPKLRADNLCDEFFWLPGHAVLGLILNKEPQVTGELTGEGKAEVFGF